jgi:hypothetical protein
MFATRTRTGSGASVTHTACGLERLDDPLGDDRVLLAVLVAAQELLAEVGVDGGVGAAAGRAGQGHRARPQPVAAHEQLGAGGDERRVAAAGAEDEARRERLAQDAEHGSGVVRARRVDLDLAGEHDLVQATGPDALDGAGDRGLVVLGRHRADDAEAPDRIGVEHRQGGRPRPPQLSRRRSMRARRSSAVTSGVASALSVSRTSSPRRAIDASGPPARRARSPTTAASRRRGRRRRSRRRRPGPSPRGPSGASLSASRPGRASAARRRGSGRGRRSRAYARSPARRGRCGRGRAARGRTTTRRPAGGEDGGRGIERRVERHRDRGEDLTPGRARAPDGRLQPCVESRRDAGDGGRRHRSSESRTA